jgi:hypothetical protein
MARTPRSHAEVGSAVVTFAQLADDRYRDLVLLLTALATRLKAVGENYLQVDAAIQHELDKIIGTAGYVPHSER